MATTIARPTRSPIVLFTMAAVLVASAGAHPDGAPPTTCITMEPGHGHVAQTGPCPFVTVPIVSRGNETSSDVVTLTLGGSVSNKTFKGFLIRANMVGMVEHVVGQFRWTSGGKIIDCQDTDNSPVGSNMAVTHTNNSEKSQVTIEWVPNGYTGEVEFRTTYVVDHGIYWVNEISVSVSVSKGVSSMFSGKHLWMAISLSLGLTLLAV